MSTRIVKNMMELVGEEAKVLDYEFAKEAGFVAVRPVTDDNVATLKWLDLEVYVRIELEVTELGVKSVAVTETMLEQYGVDKETFIQEVAEKSDFILTTMVEKMDALFERREAEPVDLQYVTDYDDGMFVLTTKSGFHGAGGMYECTAIKMLADAMLSDLFVIPCSVHEVILVRAEDRYEETTKMMIYDTNREAVAPEDVLSDNLYRYSRETEKVSIVE